jgi:transposase
MSKNPATEVQVFVGVDVSARELSVAVRSATMDREQVQTFGNNAAGRQALLDHVLRGKRRARICLEASGNYSLDLALTLHAHRRVEVSVVNPRRARRFRLMLTTPGIGETSALQILGELVVLPTTLDARQWVAFAGLDPVCFTSGTTVDKKPRISRGGSRHLRRALYMPALVAIRHEPHLRAFFQRLMAHGKAPLQAIVAVMRKLLHAFFAMFHSDRSYDGSKLCRLEATPSPVAMCAA